jgi:molybdopterin biosynthesis enzyme MoaB
MKIKYAVLFGILSLFLLACEKENKAIKTKTSFGEEVTAKRGLKVKPLRMGVISIHHDRKPLDEHDHHNVPSMLKKFNESDTKITAFIESRKESEAVAQAFQTILARNDVDMILSIGGTGLSNTDNTIEVVREMAVKEITLFGPYFCQIANGPPTIILGRPSGFMVPNRDGRILPVFCIPGHHNAIELFMRGIIGKHHKFASFGETESID